MGTKIKKILIPAAVLIALFAYCIIIVGMNDKLPGNTRINGIDCSFKNFSSAAEVLTEEIPAREIIIKNGDTEVRRIDAKEFAAMSFREETIALLGSKTNALDRILFFVYNFDYEMEPEIIVDEDAVKNLIKEIGGVNKPQNAYIIRDNSTKEFVIVPEDNGDTIDERTAEALIKKAIENNEKEVQISEAFIKAGVMSTDEELVKRTKKLNSDFKELQVKFLFKDGISTKTSVLKGDELFNMYKTDDYGVPYQADDGYYEIDSKAVKKYIESIVPSNFEQYTTETVMKETNNPDEGVKVEAVKKTREEKIEELTDWLIHTLRKCLSQNITSK